MAPISLNLDVQIYRDFQTSPGLESGLMLPVVRSIIRRGSSNPAFAGDLRCTTTRQSSSVSNNKTIFSGIQPTGVPHLGNYLGALRQWVKLQDEAESSTRLIYSLVDLHAITIRQDPAQLRQWKKESLAMLLAIGLDPARSIIFHQSEVSAHAELMWILSCQASTGYLGRMTQWKDKTSNDKDNSERLKLGLFSYPVLQAADVLIHQSTHVPVGHDQAQHLEFAREVANGFNHVYGENVLTVPETLISPARRVMSLTDPTSKMSKSHSNPKSRILLTDSEDIINAKIKSAVTDSVEGISYEPERRPGVSNLLDLIYHCTEPNGAANGQETLAKEMQGMSLRVVKERAAAAVENVVRPIREKYAEIVDDDQSLANTAEQGAEKARQSAEGTLLDVKRAVGLL
ncbi:tryptophanyl-trna synthetase like protein [Zymoseptoria brevis]|uniref:Tryptophan--tRNA ligase, mitochondrial n=1 Tax=Zymoseptoria brevis TaxID=1047168 RepID=A0A0F4GXM6_9PEZI|nr:tryptophanyl-trna synthetase like protein [Zymoseptoria brevis]